MDCKRGAAGIYWRAAQGTALTTGRHFRRKEKE